MNLLTKIAILFGRRKFEDFAQANPALPDDALAVANTLDTYPVRGAVTLVAASLAHASTTCCTAPRPSTPPRPTRC